MTTYWQIFDKEGKASGSFEFGEGGFKLSPDSSPEVAAACEEARAAGLTKRAEIYDKDTDAWLLFAVPVQPDDAAYGEALAESLENFGFRVSKLHPELVEEFSGFLSDVTQEEKAALVKDFESTTYLEQTAILEIMKEDTASAPLSPEQITA